MRNPHLWVSKRVILPIAALAIYTTTSFQVMVLIALEMAFGLPLKIAWLPVLYTGYFVASCALLTGMFRNYREDLRNERAESNARSSSE